MTSGRWVWLVRLTVSQLVCRTTGNVIGIDLGTESMKVALVQPGAPLEIVTNHFSKRKTECVVGFQNGERFFGGDAYGLLSRKPADTYARLGPLLGKTSTVEAEAMLKRTYMPTKIVLNATRGALGVAVGGQELTVEEMVAMVLSYARDMTRNYGGQNVRDCVVTVPSHATQLERAAVMRAADLADLRVLTLIDENTAAAVQFGLDRVFEEKKVVLFYNAGSENVQASVVEYSAYKDKAVKNKTVGQLHVLGKASLAGVGSFSLDLVLAELLADEFEKKFPETVEEVQIRDLPKPMAKIRAAAKKVKEVLSANTEIPVHIPSLHDDRDFSLTLTRTMLEERGAEVFAAITEPIERAVDMAGISYDAIDQVEIIGGGVRVPKVQDTVRSFLKSARSPDAPLLDLGVHLNGDEAVALGAAFHGANVSTSFRVRKVGMSDVSPFAVGVKISSSTDADWGKTASLFKRGAKYGGKQKTIAFQHDSDIFCELLYEEPNKPDDSAASIALFNISGVATFAAEMKALHPAAKPKVQLSFTLDASGITTLAKAEVSIQLNATDDSEITGNATDLAAPVPGSSSGADADVSPSKKSVTDGLNATNATSAGLNVTAKTQPPKPKVHKRGLQVATLRLGPRTWASILADAAEAKQRLVEAKKVDDARAVLAEAKNKLESAIYATRDALEDREDYLAPVSTADERAAIIATALKLEEWLYDAPDNTAADVYDEKRRHLATGLDALDLRASEKAKRPAAIAAARKALATARANATEFWPDAKPWLPKTDLDDLVAKIDTAIAWLDEVNAKQDALPAASDPAFLVSDIAPKLKPVAVLAAKLEAKPKPHPPKIANEINATNVNATDVNTADVSASHESHTLDSDAWDEL